MTTRAAIAGTRAALLAWLVAAGIAWSALGSVAFAQAPGRREALGTSISRASSPSSAARGPSAHTSTRPSSVLRA